MLMDMTKLLSFLVYETKNMKTYNKSYSALLHICVYLNN